MKASEKELQSLIKTLSDDYTLENIQYHLFVIEKIQRGIEKAEEMGIIPEEVGTASLKQWIRSYFSLLRQ
ncbi:MAG TPA: hypothetical protein PKM41_05295 [Deltaproteobacteria bacterium]|jgi:predicted hydrocarbon binding protein|nr:hypothetical protein [Deltaproteobacteria bacterium]HOI06170.1 hypothetical protein [Deltaproteobacteria bacterium]